MISLEKPLIFDFMKKRQKIDLQKTPPEDVEWFGAYGHTDNVHSLLTFSLGIAFLSSERAPSTRPEISTQSEHL